MPQDNAIDVPSTDATEPMKQTTAIDAVNALAAGDSNKFRDAVNDMLGTKVKDYLDVKKLDVAQTFLKPQEVENEEEVTADVEVDDNETDQEKKEDEEV
tara:strand:- start:3716 stop:4012 length:297 start_codon:yes stop_codon:yes gene_type:complete